MFQAAALALTLTTVVVCIAGETDQNDEHPQPQPGRDIPLYPPLVSLGHGQGPLANALADSGSEVDKMALTKRRFRTTANGTTITLVCKASEGLGNFI